MNLTHLDYEDAEIKKEKGYWLKKCIGHKSCRIEQKATLYPELFFWHMENGDEAIAFNFGLKNLKLPLKDFFQSDHLEFKQQERISEFFYKFGKFALEKKE